MGVWDEPRSIPDYAPPGAGAGCDRERAITRPSCFRGRLRRPKPHDTSVQANLWPDTRSLDGPHNRLDSLEQRARGDVRKHVENRLWMWLSTWLSSGWKLAGMDGNRTHQGHLNSALQTVLKTAGLAPLLSINVRRS